MAEYHLGRSEYWFDPTATEAVARADNPYKEGRRYKMERKKEHKVEPDRVEPDMVRVGDGLFRVYSGMAKVAGELKPTETYALGPLRPDLMARALEQANNGDVTPEMLPYLQKARRLREIFDRAVQKLDKNFKS
ncbi:hypothetical protein A3C26_01115 [Candidatus Daviesbacteria bacterium RIFCSPHIGHO2_02_FULL_39_12]|uniref:Uncharacterized protein n=2 Tax=Candidatus Daviesiibacteriota TaxID=1752718 RepID=A0A1F5JDI0_9BACT|nr:MAG: hypothetical protein A3C26_01115 [Candidatus Daviesbacteria bacterium RIFCSPHIGHO2_02_FULL_39_12]OGE72651.1 MAG: hypothetical protein A3H40_01185 [Candidatus Daviesbacteria bacterium RIFCSPLOWO2_02_FULL_38_15]